MKHLKKFLCLALSIILVLSLSACDSSDYKKAMELYESGDLDGAITAFSVLGDYEDSEDMVLKIKYEKASVTSSTSVPPVPMFPLSYNK